MVEINPDRDYYRILEVSEDANGDVIKRAYRQKARAYHPDAAHGDAARFRLVQEAYEVLGDTTFRRAYDRQRTRRGRHKDAPVSLSTLLNTETLQPMAHEQMLYVVVDVHPKEKLRDSRQRLNLALVIDCSTSMRGTRMHNVKMAVNELVDSLHPNDQLALVTFSDRAEVIKTSDNAGRQHGFRSAIAAMTAAGGTEIYQGLSLGIKQVQRHQSDDRINHVILFTDGRTYGDEDLAIRAARRAGNEGIGISAFGIGEDWNDMFLDSVARYGGGVSYYIDSPSKVRETLKSEIKGLTNLVLRKTELLASVVPYVELRHAFRVSPHMEILPIEKGQSIKTGDISGQDTLTLLLELVVNHDEIGTKRIMRLELTGKDVQSSEVVTVQQDVHIDFTYHHEETSVPPRLLNLVARLSVFRLQEKAWQSLESGDTRQATRYLESAATHLFDMGYRELGRAAMLEVGRLTQGTGPTVEGRKKLRYGTRALSIPSS